MNQKNLLILLVLIQLAFSSTILISSPNPPTYQDVLNGQSISNTGPLNIDISRAQFLATLNPQFNQNSNNMQSQLNSSASSSQPVVQYYRKLINNLTNQTNNNQTSTSIVIAPRSFGLIVPETKPNLSQQTLEYLYQPNKLAPKSKMYVYFRKNSTYSLSFNLIITSSSIIDINTQVTATIQANNNATTLDVFPGQSKQIIYFDGSFGSNEISLSLQVGGNYNGFVHAILMNIEVVQVQ